MAGLRTVFTLVILAGAAIMAVSLYHMQDVLSILTLATGNDRTWLARRIQAQRGLMAFFLLGYLGLAAALWMGRNVHTESLMTVVLILGAVFVFVGVGVQRHMTIALVRTIQGLVPICAWCKRVRSDGPAEEIHSWEPVEQYIAHHADVDFTHGICPECLTRMQAEDEAAA